MIATEAPVRYAWIRTQLGGVLVRRPPTGGTWTDRLDAVLTHRLVGPLILVAVLGTVFQAIFTLAAYPMDWIDAGLVALGAGLEGALPEGLVRSLVVDGVVGGVGAVIVFLPQIAILFFFLACLEDCGYLARAAFLLDRVLQPMGLSGKSVMPLLSSFACAVPGIMATRTIEDRRDRLATILVAPLMSCSARFPVYSLLIAAFVPARGWLGGTVTLQALTMLGFHLLGVLVAIPMVFCFKRTLLRGASPPFVMELPPYTWPSPRTVARRVYDRSWAFVRRAGTIIFAVSVAVWSLTYAPRPPEIHERHEEARAVARATLAGEALAARLTECDRAEKRDYLAQSVIGSLGHAIEPAVRPLGWDWRIGVAAIASFPAREVVVATLGTIYQAGDADDEAGLRDAVRAARWEGGGPPVFSLAVALSLMVFFALCAQCSSTLVVIKRETGSWGWAGLTFGYMTTLAYLGALVTYQGACALGLG